jgi:gas vesicle protein
MTDCRGVTHAGLFLAGLAVGSAVALLLAPKSGRETRRMISRKAEDSREYLLSRGKELRRRAEGTLERGKDLASKFVH